MRSITVLFVLLVPALAAAQTPAEKAAALKYVHSLYDPATGGYKVTPAGKPSLRACNGAAKAVKYLGGELQDRAMTAAFVMSCYDPATGGFAEPGGKPDVAVTSVGVMAAVELGVPKEKFAKAMDYLKANAKTFEDVRIGAAAVEAWGVKECPFDLEPWFKIAKQEQVRWTTSPDRSTVEVIKGMPRARGSELAFQLRLGHLTSEEAGSSLAKTQWDDGGWGLGNGGGCDLESTYRVMRALYLAKTPPKDPVKLREFIAKCRNADGGYGVKPGEKSTMSGVYYAAVVGHWLDELDKK